MPDATGAGTMNEATIFIAALEQPSEADRAAFLAEACAGDERLRRRVEALLRAHGEPDDILDPTTVWPEATGATIPPAPEASEPGPSSPAATSCWSRSAKAAWGRSGWPSRRSRSAARSPSSSSRPAWTRRPSCRASRRSGRRWPLMDHPNIAKVLTAARPSSGRPFFVMEYVKGVPITRYCDDARLSIAERLRSSCRCARPSSTPISKGIIHRDLKPYNILIGLYDGQPVPKVIDFGLAKAMHQPLTEHTLYTAHGDMMGTPLYMSPEQAELNNLDLDTRTDIYALGVILYELLTGTTPMEKQRFRRRPGTRCCGSSRRRTRSGRARG